MFNSRQSIWLVLLVVAACETPRPTSTVVPTDAPIAPSPSPAAVAIESPDPTPTPAVPLASALINDAIRDGELDATTGYLYRYYAMWGDARLPEQYRGARVEDHALVSIARESFEAAPAEQEALLPVVTRPTHVASYWSTLPEAPTAASGPRLAAAQADDPRCNRLWARRDLPAIPVTVWGRCTFRLDGSKGLQNEDAWDGTALAVSALWGPMTKLMGKPRPDSFTGSRKQAWEVEEAGDGRIDIYVVEGPNIQYGRDIALPSRSLGMAVDVPSRDGGAASGYIVIDAAAAGRSPKLENVVAHEFFHVLEFRHEARGLIVCPYPNVTLACLASDKTVHWFAEASSAWAEHEFVPQGRSISPYLRFRGFLESGMSLSDTTDDNEYVSFMWPLFMEQQSGLGPAAVASAWSSLHGKSGWLDIQKAIDAALPFETEFREFAVRVWNADLPGKPIDPLFRHSSLDPDFPPWLPFDSPIQPRFKRDITLLADVLNRQSVKLPELWAAYYLLTPPADAGRLTLNFGRLLPNDRLDVDAIVKVGDVYERRQLDPQVTEWCLDVAGKRIGEVILVLSNHSWQPSDDIRGDWTAKAETTGCLTASDSLVFTSTNTYGTSGVGVYNKSFEKLALHLRLKSNDGTTEFLSDYLNDGSTFEAQIQTEGFIETADPACPLLSEGVGGGGGPVPGLDGVVASLTQVFDPVPGASIGPDGRWILNVAAHVTVDMTTTSKSCIGTGSEVSEEVVQLPTCAGTEVLDADPARIFDFNCAFSGGGADWSLIGKVKLSG